MAAAYPVEALPLFEASHIARVVAGERERRDLVPYDGTLEMVADAVLVGSLDSQRNQLGMQMGLGEWGASNRGLSPWPWCCLTSGIPIALP